MDEAGGRRQYPVFYLIGWLSLCIVAAGWSSIFTTPTSVLWRNAGIFGLVAACGLESSERYRIAHAARKMRRAIEAKLRKNQFVSRQRLAVKRFCADLERRAVQRVRIREDEGPRIMPPALITPFEDGTCGKVSIPAVVRDLSETGIGLLVEQNLPAGFALLQVDSAGEETTPIVVNIRWSKQLSPGRFVSGCELVGSETARPQPFVRLTQWCFQ